MPTPTPTSRRSKTASASASASKRSQAVPTWQEPMTNFFIRKNNKRIRTPNPSTPKKPIQYLDNTVPEQVFFWKASCEHNQMQSCFTRFLKDCHQPRAPKEFPLN